MILIEQQDNATYMTFLHNSICKKKGAYIHTSEWHIIAWQRIVSVVLKSGCKWNEI